MNNEFTGYVIKRMKACPRCQGLITLGTGFGHSKWTHGKYSKCKYQERA